MKEGPQKILYKRRYVMTEERPQTLSNQETQTLKHSGTTMYKKKCTNDVSIVGDRIIHT